MSEIEQRTHNPLPLHEPDDRLLTPDELDAIDRTADLWNQLCDIVADGPGREGDLAEIATHIHAIQRAVMAQAAARTYPDRFRLLGSTVTQEAQ